MTTNPPAPERTLAPRSRRRKPGGPNTAALVLAIALVVSVAGSLVTFIEVRAAFARHTAVDTVQTLVDALYRRQLEEDTGLRGFLVSGDKIYLAPYTGAQATFDEDWRRLQAESARTHLHTADVLLADLHHAHDDWIAQVAKPLIKSPSAPDAVVLLQRGKALSDRMHADFDRMTQVYAFEGQSATAEVESLFVRAAVSMATLILVFGLAAIIADLYRTRTQAALERERVVADTLQRAFLSGWDALPGVRVGTAYLSSTRDAAVGGDLFDVHRLGADRSLVLVADVSGKGLGAAVETAQVKYSVRTLAEDLLDPAAILARFNHSFLRGGPDPSSFISVFVGIIDHRSHSFTYASAGHSPAYLRRGAEVERLSVTGPVIGLTMDAAFTSATLALVAGDTIVLATDGLTEARDGAGVLVDDDGVMRWIAAGDRDAESLAGELVRNVARFAGGRINDDLALVVLEVEAPPAAVRSSMAVATAPNGAGAGPLAGPA